MAVLTEEELAKLRRRYVREAGGEVTDFNKDQINDAFQVMEDWFEGERAGVSTLIDNGVTGYTFNNTQKKRIGGVYLILKSEKELL